MKAGERWYLLRSMRASKVFQDPDKWARVLDIRVRRWVVRQYLGSVSPRYLSVGRYDAEALVKKTRTLPPRPFGFRDAWDYGASVAACAVKRQLDWRGVN